MPTSFKPGLVTLLVLILAVSLIWGNHLVFNLLADISYQNAPHAAG